MDKYIDKQYLIANLKAFKNQILDPKYASLGEDGKISKAVVPSLSAAEVGALPEDTEIPIFTNKAVLDKISEEKVESWDEAVTSAHTHDNKIVLDKFTESDEGEVLYKGKQIASGNLWNGTKEELDGIKEDKIAQSKKMLSEWLASHPYLYSDGKYYSCTEEKQSLLNGNLASYERAKAIGVEYPLKWNATTAECTEFSYNDLLALSLSIAAYVAPKVSKQQSIEVQIRNCETVEAVDAIEINYDETNNQK